MSFLKNRRIKKTKKNKKSNTVLLRKSRWKSRGSREDAEKTKIFKFDSIEDESTTFVFKEFKHTLEGTNSTASTGGGFEFGSGDNNDMFNFSDSKVGSTTTFVGSPDTTKKNENKTTCDLFCDDKEPVFTTTRFDTFIRALKNFNLDVEPSREQYMYALDIYNRNSKNAPGKTCVLETLLIDQAYATSLPYAWFPKVLGYLDVRDLTKCTSICRSVYFCSLNIIGVKMSDKSFSFADNINKYGVNFVQWSRSQRRRYEFTSRVSRVKQAYFALNRGIKNRKISSIEAFFNRSQGDTMTASLIGFTWRVVCKELMTVLYTKILFKKMVQDMGMSGEKILNQTTSTSICVFWKKDIQVIVEKLCANITMPCGHKVTTDELDEVFAVVINDPCSNGSQKQAKVNSISRSVFCTIFDGLGSPFNAVKEDEKFVCDFFNYLLAREKQRRKFAC